jgi:OTU domain-containing protein 6
MMEDLLARHRKERNELQGKITQKKKNATKKTRKGVNDECETLERTLKERQQAEIHELEAEPVTNGVECLDLGSKEADDENHSEPEQKPVAKTVSFDINTKQEPIAPTEQRSKKPNRQKARLARRAAEQEAQIAAAEEEAANLPDLREQEMKAMKEQLKKRHLAETFIQPDGHCLYSACAMGLDPNEVKKSGPHSPPYQNVRYAAADFIRQHPDDFAPFIEEPLDEYVKKIRDTAEWGGQLELQAIARSYKINIRVLQADGRVEDIESESETKDADIWLAYYRHSFGLGEHYNALKKVEKT